MIITKTPFRISFVGGGSDLEAFFSKSKGAVLSSTINQYMYISSHAYFEPDKLRVKYSQTETVDSVNDIKHPILRTAFNMFNIKGGLEVSSIADLPSGTGMGSSSSFTVGLLHNLHARTNSYTSKHQLAAEACDLEINRLGEPIGKQDQYAAAFGGLNVIEFHANGEVSVDPVYLAPEIYSRLESSLCLYYIGNQRSASAILSEQRKNTADVNKFQMLKQMVSLVYELRTALMQGDLDRFGSLMHENWLMKQELASGISSPMINEIYETALKNGASGGKLLGAGGGGFMLFYCAPEKQPQLNEALQKVRRFPFSFEQEGSKLIHYDHE